MALTLLEQPATMCFARNQAIVKLFANNAGALYDAIGPGSKITYVATDRFAVNATITITYTEPDATTEAVVFTAKASPATDNEIVATGYSGTDAQYWEAVRAKIAAHPRIAPYFDVQTITESGNLRLRVRAKSTEAGWSVVITNSASFTVTAVAAAASTLPANYKVLLDVYIETSYKAGTYTQAAQLLGYPEQGTGNVVFDISGILAAGCKSSRNEPQIPTYGTTSIQRCDNTRRYYFRYSESYGVPIVAQDWAYSAVKYCMDGGLSQSLFAETPDYLGDLSATDSLLTWQADGKALGISSPEYLNWYNYTGEQRSIRVEMQYYDIDNNALSTATRHHTAKAIDAYETATLPVSPELLGLDTIADAYKYRVRVVYLDDALIWQPLSQWRTYLIDRSYYESERQIQYLNAFGMPECWRCTGNWSRRLSIDRSIATRPVVPGYNQYATEQWQFERRFQNEIIYRTGFITYAQSETLQEMLISGEVYDVTSAGYIPLRLTTNDFAVNETRQEIFSYTFTALPRLEMVNYSKKKLQAIITGAWQETDGNAWFDTFMVAWQE